jgi:ribosomal protein L4
VHADRGTIAVVDASAYDKPSTKTAAQSLEKWGAKAPILIVLGAEEEAVAKSFRNIPRIRVAQANAAGVADVIGAASLVVSQAALETLEERSVEPKKRSLAAKSESAPAATKASQTADPGSEAEESAADGEAVNQDASSDAGEDS